jgi:hypothetical protein
MTVVLAERCTTGDDAEVAAGRTFLADLLLNLEAHLIVFVDVRRNLDAGTHVLARRAAQADGVTRTLRALCQVRLTREAARFWWQARVRTCDGVKLARRAEGALVSLTG